MLVYSIDVLYDAECLYWDRASLNDTKIQAQTNWFMQAFKPSMKGKCYISPNVSLLQALKLKGDKCHFNLVGFFPF